MVLHIKLFLYCIIIIICPSCIIHLCTARSRGLGSVRFTAGIHSTAIRQHVTHAQITTHPSVVQRESDPRWEGICKTYNVCTYLRGIRSLVLCLNSKFKFECRNTVFLWLVTRPLFRWLLIRSSVYSITPILLLVLRCGHGSSVR